MALSSPDAKDRGQEAIDLTADLAAHRGGLRAPHRANELVDQRLMEVRGRRVFLDALLAVRADPQLGAIQAGTGANRPGRVSLVEIWRLS